MKRKKTRPYGSYGRDTRRTEKDTTRTLQKGRAWGWVEGEPQGRVLPVDPAVQRPRSTADLVPSLGSTPQSTPSRTSDPYPPAPGFPLPFGIPTKVPSRPGYTPCLPSLVLTPSFSPSRRHHRVGLPWHRPSPAALWGPGLRSGFTSGVASGVPSGVPSEVPSGPTSGLCGHVTDTPLLRPLKRGPEK